MIKLDFLGKSDNEMKELVYNGLASWENILKSKKLADSTIERKIRDIGMFYQHLVKVRKTQTHIKPENITDILFEYVRDGYFSVDNLENEGTYGYRRAIFYNIQEGFNYIYDKYFEYKTKIVDDLTNEKKEMLDDISKNKFFKSSSLDIKEENNKETIQTKLIKDLGIKVYFDENGKPYTFSHELAELIGKKASETNRAVKNLNEKISQCNFAPTSGSTDFTMVEDTYTDCQNKTVTTYKLYKDLLLTYVLGLTGQNITIFKIKYIDAFNYIEQEHNRLLEEYSKLKESFINMYNDMRRRNRDLLVISHNKKAKVKSTKKKVS